MYTRATPDDAADAAATTAAGFGTYAAFAPPGWRPPAEVSSIEATRKRLEDDDVWALVARTPEGETAGHIAFCSSKTSRWPEKLDDLAHLWQLFVREPYWGTGVAATLHARALDEAARQGYAAMRLYTPAGQARARRFYEREGWSLRGDPLDVALGIPVVEYRRALRP